MTNCSNTITMWGIICAMRHGLLALRNPEFDMIREGREGDFDDAVKRMLSPPATLLTSDPKFKAFDAGYADWVNYRSVSDPSWPSGDPDYTEELHQAYLNGWNHASKVHKTE